MHNKSRTERRQQKELNKRLLIVGGIILVLLVATGTAAYFYRHTLFPTNTPSDTPVTVKPVQGAQVIDEATQLVRSGNTQAAQQKLDEAIANTDSKEEQATFYALKARTSAATDLDAAIQSAITASELIPNDGLYAYIAELAERKGDNALAIEYYQKAIEHYNANPPVEKGSQGPESYQTRIDLLRG